MNLASMITSIIFIVCCVSIGIPSILSWKKADENHEFIFNFGVSFLVLGFTFIIYLTSEFIDISSFVVTIHLLDTFVFLKQLQAIEYIMRNCNVSKNSKMLRLSTNMIMFIFILLFGCGLYGYGLDGSHIGMKGLQVIGYLPLDILFESCHAIISFYIFYRLINYNGFSYLKIGFLFIAVSEIFQLLNIILYGYSTNILYISEWILANAGILLMFISTYLVLRKSDNNG